MKISPNKVVVQIIYDKLKEPLFFLLTMICVILKYRFLRVDCVGKSDSDYMYTQVD